MRIYNISTIPFTSKKPVTISVNSAKKDFYSHIDGFLNRRYDKKQYIDLFSEDVKSLSKKQITTAERKYIDDMLTTLDLAEKANKISDKYIADSMKKLLEAKKN